MADPVLDEDDDQEEVDSDAPESPTPPARDATIAQLEGEIARLRAELGCTDEPVLVEAGLKSSMDDIISTIIPLPPGGIPIKINGKRIAGKWSGKRSTLMQILSMIDAKRNIERERLEPRGNAMEAGAIVGRDAASRIIARRPGRTVIA